MTTARAFTTMILAGVINLLSSFGAQAEGVLIRNATLYTMGPAGRLEATDLLVEGGRISAIGADLSPTATGITVVEAGGRIVTPGLFAGINSLGLEEVTGEAQTIDNSYGVEKENELGAFRPEFDVTRAYNPNSSLIPITRIEGYSFALLAARRAGSIIAGQGRMVTLDGGYRSFSGERTLFIDLGASVSEASGGSRAGQWMLLEQALDEVASAPRGAEPRLLTRAGRSILASFKKSGRVIFNVDRASDILGVLDFARAHSLSAVITGGAEAWMVREQLATANTPVILDPLLNLPGNFDRLGARLDNAALLHEAGVLIAFAQTPDMESHNARRMRQLAGNAVAHGLPYEAALAALTVNPAKIFGISATAGTLEKGKRGDVTIWSGDPLEVNTVAEQVLIDGTVLAMESRQTLLRDRYLAVEKR